MKSLSKLLTASLFKMPSHVLEISDHSVIGWCHLKAPAFSSKNHFSFRTLCSFRVWELRFYLSFVHLIWCISFLLESLLYLRIKSTEDRFVKSSVSQQRGVWSIKSAEHRFDQQLPALPHLMIDQLKFKKAKAFKRQ